MDLIQRLKTFLDSRGIGVTQFADECAIPRPTASQLLAGRNKKVSDEMIGKIHQVYPELSVMWLMFGEGNMIANSHGQESGSMQSSRSVNESPELHAQPSDYYTPGAESPYNLGTEFGNMAVANGTQNSNLETQTTPLSGGRNATVGQQTFSFGGGQVGNQMPVNAPGKETQMVGNVNPAHSVPQTQAENVGKKVVGVVVFYDDNSFQSFSPDAVANLPFIQK